MATRCSHCGAHAPTGAKVCFMCGTRLSGEAVPAGVAKTELGTPLHLPPSAQGMTPMAGAAVGPTEHAPPGYGPGATQAAAGPPPAGPAGGYGTPPSAAAGPPPAGPPGGYGTPPSAAAGPPPAGPPMAPGMMGGPPGPYGHGPSPGPAKADDSALKIGCGIAGCFGVVLVLLAAGGLLLYLLQPGPVASGGGPSSGGPSTGGPSSGSSPTAEPTSAPESGSLRSLVEEQVGPYRLTASSPNVADGPFREGAIDSLGLKYESAAGVEIKHFLIVYGTEAEAAAKPKAMIELIRKQIPSDQTFTVRSQPYKNRDGDVIGKVHHVELDPEVVMWNNGKLFAVANGPASHPLQFFKAVSY